MTKEAIGQVEIRIRPSLLGAIAKWAYQDPDRPHLTVVRFGDGEIVALDGHRAVIMPCEDVREVTFGIEAKICASIAAAYKAGGYRFGEISIDVPPEPAPQTGIPKTRVTIAPGFEMWVPITNVDDYPPYKQVIPGKPETDHPPEYRFDIRYLAAIEEIIREHPAGSVNELRIASWTAIGKDGIAGPALFEGPAGMKFIIMPMRGPREGD